jgi:uncharacterized protein
MRVVLDTNILIAALMVHTNPPGVIYQAWSDGAFTLLSCDQQLDELRRTLRKPAVAPRIRTYEAGRMINDLRAFAEMIDPLPAVERSSDPQDDFLLALAEAGKADYLVTGDKAGLLDLKHHHGTRILSPKDFAELLS